MVMGENIAQTFQFVYSGNADIGLVAYSQTLSPAVRGQGSSWLVPSEHHQGYTAGYGVAQESRLPPGSSPLLWNSDLAREILTEQGYLLSDGR